MITPAYIHKTCLLLLLTLFQVTLFCQQDKVFALQNEVNLRISIDTTINDDTRLDPFTSQLAISGLAFSGKIILYSDSSLVRIILIDKDFNEYLIYEAYPILSGSGEFSVDEAGEETFLLNNITPSGITIELVDASLYLKEIIISKEEPYQTKTRSERLFQQTDHKINRINQNIYKLGQSWVAGETSISKLSYQERKSMFGGKVPNFQGFEYYVGGVFVMPGAKSNNSDTREIKSENSTQLDSQYPDEFSWKDRHGEDWATPVKFQGGCGSCYAFGATAATELLVNIYFNQHLDYDLSEQNIVSCSGGSCTAGGTLVGSADYLKKEGIVLEDCFPYAASDLNCTEICNNPSERIKIASWTICMGEEDNKKEIIKGATAASIPLWEYHMMQILGYKVIEAGDSLYVGGFHPTSHIPIRQGNPLIGETAWLCKNSWGETWGNNGFGYLIGDEQGINVLSFSGPVSSLIYSEADVACTDNDDDGYYNWGIGPKPSHCPDCPDEADGNDSDPCLGPMDEFGNLLSAAPTPEAKDTIILYGQPNSDLFASGSNIQWYSDIELQNLVHSGNLFSTGHTEPGEYTYYVTQTLSGCESEANKLSLSIVTGIPPPIGHDTVIDVGEPAVLTVQGQKDAIFNWYEDPSLTILLDTGKSYLTEKTDTGVYIYYVTQTLCLIESASDTVSLTITNHVDIPDKNFLNALISAKMDKDGNNLISYAEAGVVTSMDVHKKSISSLIGNISDLTGIEAFTNLKYLDCSYNNLTSLDVTNNTALTVLSCEFNPLTRLNVSNNTALEYLNIARIHSLYKVCVWEMPFPTAGVDVNTFDSPNVYFTTNCLKDSMLNIYPNPSNDIINVEIKKAKNATLEIYNFSGYLLMGRKLNSVLESIDISGLSVGLYFIKVRQENNVRIKKLIVY